MPRRAVVATATLSALASAVTAAPVLADETSGDVVTYVQQDVRSHPKKGEEEHVTLDVPADWTRDRLNRVSVGFFDYQVHTRWVTVDLDPHNDTVEEMRAEVRSLRDLGDRYYKEHDFRVNEADEEIEDEIRVRWVFAYRDAPTDDTWSYTSVFLMQDDLLVIDGRRRQKDELKDIRKHVVTTYASQPTEGSAG